ncbi:MAG TPA: NHLP leader peptide family RiPP precursor [Streptosporangiaceae bacterium]
MARAAEDPSFRSQLKSDPKGTLERELGGTMPADIRIEVLEETPAHVYLVLPTPESKELTADELAGVAGGGLLDRHQRGVQFRHDLVTMAARGWLGPDLARSPVSQAASGSGRR